MHGRPLPVQFRQHAGSQHIRQAENGGRVLRLLQDGAGGGAAARDEFGIAPMGSAALEIIRIQAGPAAANAEFAPGVDAFEAAPVSATAAVF